MARTGLRYLGESRYAYKRALGYNSFISLEELFEMYGAKAGFSIASQEFINWLFTSGNVPTRDFEFEVDPSEFDAAGNFKVSAEPAPPKTRKLAEERPLKSSQVLAKDLAKDKEQASDTEETVPQEDDYGLIDHLSSVMSTEEEENLETVEEDFTDQVQFSEKLQGESVVEVQAPPPPNMPYSGMVKVESGDISVSSDFQEAENSLVEQAKSLHPSDTSPRNQQKHMQSTIVDNRVEKPMKTEQSQIVSGGTNKERSKRTRSVVLGANQLPVGVDTTTPNLANDNSRSFVYTPVPSQADVNANPTVNYGGKGSPKPRIEVSGNGEVTGTEKKNVLRQPPMASLSDLRSPVTVDTIVRNSSDGAALAAIQECKNSQILKIAAKQLRGMGTKPKLEQAISRRLASLPPGSVG